jgi:hypothetical protein
MEWRCDVWGFRLPPEEDVKSVEREVLGVVWVATVGGSLYTNEGKRWSGTGFFFLAAESLS